MEYTKGGLKINTEETVASDDIKETLLGFSGNFEKMENSLDALVLEGGDSNPEIILSRRDNLSGEVFATLQNRLDNQNKKTKDKIDGLENEKANKVDVNKKVDRTYFDMVIANIVDGSPRELFYSVATLQSTYPNGEVGTYLVFDSSFTDGAHTFMWNGTAWEDLGIYQAVGIADKSVTPQKTDFIYTAKNLINTLNADFGFINYLNGDIESSETYKTSDFISVTAGDYTIQKVRVYVIYDQNKQVISGQNLGSNLPITTISVPQVGYVRLCYHTNFEKQVMLEVGSVATAYEPYKLKVSDEIKIDYTQIENVPKPKPTGDLKVIKTGANYVLRSAFNNNEDIVIALTRNVTANNLFNFVQTRIVPRVTADTDILTAGVQIHNTPDDVAPIRTNIATVGANHGYTTCFTVTVSGKTNVDRGSIWTDGVHQYTLLIVNGNMLTFACDYTLVDGIPHSSYVTPTTTLTHVSGATNTTDVPINNLAQSQLYPSVNNVTVEFKLDEQLITQDGIYYGNNFVVNEIYSVMDYKDMLDKARANIGSYHASNSIAGLVRLQNTYSFADKLICQTYHNVIALKKVKLGRCGFLQSVMLNKLDNHTRKRIMPFVKPKTGFNFAQGVDLDAYNVSLLFTAADNTIDGVPPSYYFDWIVDNANIKKYGFTMGYLVDVTNTKNEDRIANSAHSWDMRNTKKSYPVAITDITLDAGGFMDFAGFRSYTNTDVVTVKDYTYVANDIDKGIYSLTTNDGIVNVLQTEKMQVLGNYSANSEIICKTDSTNSASVIKISTF